MPTYLSPGVYMEEVSAGPKPIEAVGTSTAAFVGFAERGPVNDPTLVTSWPQYTRTFGDFVEGAYLPLAVFNYFLNGGGNAYVVRVGADAEAEAAAAQNGAPKELTTYAQATLAGDEGKPALSIRTVAPADEAKDIEVEVSDSGEGNADTFKLDVLQGGKVVESYDNVGLKRGPNSVMTALRESKFILATDVKAASLQVTRGRTALAPPETSPELPLPEVSADTYVGDVSDRTGFGGLEALEDVTMLVVPDAMAAYERGAIDAEGLKAIQLAMIAHCELMSDRVAILDTPAGLTAQKVKEWRMDFAGYVSEVPEHIDIDHLETPSPLNPLGVKGAGEAGVIPGAAAIASAIEDAEGIPITSMPMSPSELFELRRAHAEGRVAGPRRSTTGRAGKKRAARPRPRGSRSSAPTA